MRELSVTEQRYKAVLALISNGRTVTEVARDWNVSRQTLHQWLGRYEEEGFVGLANRSHRPVHCPHQIAPDIEVQLPEVPGIFAGSRTFAEEWLSGFLGAAVADPHRVFLSNVC